MKLTFLAIILVFFASCSEEEKTNEEVDQLDLSKREINVKPGHLNSGRTYLSLYSQIYSRTEHTKRDLTVTVSMRNTSSSDSLYLTNISCFDTGGELIKKYSDGTIYLMPMETLEIIIKEDDPSSGTGGNFIFDWMIPKNGTEPLFEAVMISTAGQQGISFITTGKRVK